MLPMFCPANNHVLWLQEAGCAALHHGDFGLCSIQLVEGCLGAAEELPGSSILDPGEPPI